MNHIEKTTNATIRKRTDTTLKDIFYPPSNMNYVITNKSRFWIYTANRKDI